MKLRTPVLTQSSGAGSSDAKLSSASEEQAQADERRGSRLHWAASACRIVLAPSEAIFGHRDKESPRL